MAYKVLVMDIDGTLYNSVKQITVATRQAIFKARDAGIILAIASGRPLPGIRDACETLEFARMGGYVMGYNGGRILNAQTGEFIRDISLPPDTVPRIASLAATYGVPVVGHDPDVLVTQTPDDEIIRYEARLNRMPVAKIPSLADYHAQCLYKCIMTGSAEKMAEMERVAAREFEGQLSVFRSEPYFLEILPPGVNKAGAIDILAEHLHLTTDDFIACGDGFNDLSMIRRAGLGVAMANAQQIVKESADCVTASCDEDGLVPVIEKYLLA